METEGKMFPVMVGQYQQATAYVPWTIVARCAKRLDKTHGQTVERLAERGGLSPCELASAMVDLPWREMKPSEAWAVIFAKAQEPSA